MSDIDFDELDKAVNNLMANVDTTKRNESVDDPEDNVVTLESTAAPEQSAEEQAPVPPESQPSAAADSTPNQVSAAPALAVKRRGQFMDVMHPSSDMKAAKPVKREGVTLAPATPIAPVATESPSLPDQPTTPAVADSETPVEAPSGIDTVVVTDDTLGQPPLTSPFLPDAKPEKRPLGSAAAETPAPIVDLAAELESESDTSLPAEDPQVEMPVELPEELGSDVLAIESNSIPEAAEPTIEQPVEPEAAAEEAPVEEPATVPAGGSIPQQYTESPSSGDQTNGSIYDTSNYHQPIEAAPAAKKSSPLKWIILAIVLLVLGAGGGVGYFVLTHGLPF